MNPRRELAPYAARIERSRGRRVPEPAPAHRSEYQRDRDRVVHSTAFRRLMYKTQVFVNHDGDMYRTRLTHSLEVAQIGRSVARALALDEDLTEAISIAHDLGHTPFGHAGQDALDECMREHGGFEHNLQSLRVVDELEERYAGFNGLNLTYESREGILKHCPAPHARTLGELGARFLARTQPGLEAQLANLADGVAYNNHDVDDGLRSGLISVEQLVGVTAFRRAWAATAAAHPGLAPRRAVHETVRAMIGELVADLIAESGRRIAAAGVASIDDVRALHEPLIGFSAERQAEVVELKRFLRRELYQHERVRSMTAMAQRVVRELFRSFRDDPTLMPTAHAAAAGRAAAADGPSGRARAVADYIAGMTDRFALAEHARLFGATAADGAPPAPGPTLR